MRRVIVVAGFVLALGAQQAWGCQVAGNLIPNCGFPMNLIGWQFSGVATHEPNDGSSANGSANIVSAEGVVTIGSECVSVNINTDYGYGIDHRLISGAPTSCELRVNFFAEAGCGGGAAPSETAPIIPTGAWGQTNDSLNSGASALSANISVLCTGPAGASFTMRFDDGFLGAGLTPVELQSFSVQ